MTVRELIDRLEWMADQVGDDCRVVLADQDVVGIRSQGFHDYASETGLSNLVILIVGDRKE